jgi:hypothetical protein
MTHKLVLIRQTEAFVEWECPACNRHMRLALGEGGLEILNPGDQEVNHGTATTVPGFYLHSASAEAIETH